jgi:hypothetical protein
MIPALAAAQEEGELPAEFSSDRPGFALATAVAPTGRLITEMGAVVDIDEPVSLRLPSLSLRAGVFEWLELRARGPDAIVLFEDDARAGVADPFVGFKLGGLVHEQVSISAAFEASLPLATDGFGAPEAEIFASAQLEWRFWGPLSLTPNAVLWVRAEEEAAGDVARYVEGGGSLKLTWAIIDVVRVFAHGYVVASERRDLRAAVGAAVTWLVLPNVQLDAWFDVVVTGPEIPAAVGAGTTVLW